MTKGIENNKESFTDEDLFKHLNGLKTSSVKDEINGLKDYYKKKPDKKEQMAALTYYEEDFNNKKKGDGQKKIEIINSIENRPDSSFYKFMAISPIFDINLIGLIFKDLIEKPSFEDYKKENTCLEQVTAKISQTQQNDLAIG